MDETDDEIGSENGCPYCSGGWGCSHEFLLTEGGYIIVGFLPGEAVYELMVRRIEEVFNGLLSSKDTNPVWSTDWVNDLWKDALEYTPKGERVSLKNLIDQQALVMILGEMLDDAPQITENRSICRDDTPGLTDVAGNYFCEDVGAVEKTFTKNIEVVLTPQSID